tara:strand:+ start:267 stop:476 length:210 start_codon:yes stop_codon:yes gene_type:complete
MAVVVDLEAAGPVHQLDLVELVVVELVERRMLLEIMVLILLVEAVVAVEEVAPVLLLVDNLVEQVVPES